MQTVTFDVSVVSNGDASIKTIKESPTRLSRSPPPRRTTCRLPSSLAPPSATLLSLWTPTARPSSPLPRQRPSGGGDPTGAGAVSDLPNYPLRVTVSCGHAACSMAGLFAYMCLCSADHHDMQSCSPLAGQACSPAESSTYSAACA